MVASVVFHGRGMKENPPEQPLADKDAFAKRKPRRRKFGPNPNIATWIIIAWLAFMASWGCKHLYRLWAESEVAHDEPAASVTLTQNATGQRDF